MTQPFTLEMADDTSTDPHPPLTFICTGCGARPAELVTDSQNDPPEETDLVRCGACGATFGRYGEVVERAETFGRQESAKRVQALLPAAGIDISVESPER